MPALTFPQSPGSESQGKVPAIKVHTQLVLIPAEVTDSKGNRVTDMKKEDFAVFENGKREEIALFDHITTKAEMIKPVEAPPGAFTNTMQRGPNRITIFVVDLLNSKTEEQKEARKQILEFLSKSLNEQEPVCLMSIDAKGVWLIHGFSTDPKILMDSLRELKQQPSDPDKPPKNPEEELYKTMAGWHSKDGQRVKAALEARLSMLRTAVGFEDLSMNERIRMTLLSLLEIGNAFVGLPGRKSLIWAGAGFPFAANNAAAFAKDWKVGNADGQDLLPLYAQTWRTLEEANIAVYPLDVSELGNPAYAGPGMGEALPEHVMVDTHLGNMENFADMTGGRLCDRSMEAKKCFEQAAADSADYYLLGIYDKSGTEKPGWRKLSVSTERAGLKIRARSGYYVSAGAQAAPTEKKLMEMALFSPFEYTGLSLNVQLTGAAPGKKPETKIVRFEYTIPGGAVLVSQDDGNHLKLEFGAVARDASGKMAASFTKVLEGKLSEAQSRQINEKGISFKGEMELGPGEYALSFAALDQVNDNTGSVLAPYKVE
jgi:VWFA-related protein